MKSVHFCSVCGAFYPSSHDAVTGRALGVVLCATATRVSGKSTMVSRIFLIVAPNPISASRLSISRATRPRQAPRLYSLRKNSGFVSGWRFSDTANLEINRPSRAGRLILDTSPEVVATGREQFEARITSEMLLWATGVRHAVSITDGPLTMLG